MDLKALTTTIKAWARELGFADCRIADANVGDAAERYRQWIAHGRHGEMDYMERHAALRADPKTLLPDAMRAICVRADYLPAHSQPDWREQAWDSTHDPLRATVSRYAHGRDYHKVLRHRLATLAERITHEIGDAHQYRVFTDSAPVMEVELAMKAGLGWRGKHTLLLNRDGGSMFFLGGLYTNLPLPMDEPTGAHCGSCSACMDICPTRAIVGPYELDARRCISYLTIELKGPIPVDLRPLIGNRIYGCDDCQLICPWNKYAHVSSLRDFDPRHGLDRASLLELWSWTDEDFLSRTQGSAIRRIGYERWRRNLAVGLGNALRQTNDSEVRDALARRVGLEGELVDEHVRWALGAGRLWLMK
ncbi:MAG TPA: tRNA epoxyqueuosine(34) reductase QueG [Burkholderiaceae bacterium]|nr:tRNA epoxyqueuosine(34) reductase QueG [Burkholderiaceae bacterium]